MKKKILLCFISLIGIFILAFIGCKETDRIEDFYGNYELSHVKCNYYDNGVFRSKIYATPSKNIFLGSTEQVEFFNEVYDLLGTKLYFKNKFLTFNGKLKEAIEYSYSDISSDGSFRFNFNNIFGEQNGSITKYMNGGRTSVWLDYVNNTVKNRQITIECSLYVEGQGPLDIKPVATFEFAFSN